MQPVGHRQIDSLVAVNNPVTPDWEYKIDEKIVKKSKIECFKAIICTNIFFEVENECYVNVKKKTP